MKSQSKYLFNLFTIFAMLISLFGSATTITPAHAAASQISILGPEGSDKFGANVTLLPNGNFVVADPFYDAPGLINVGAVYLYNGATHALISTLTGSTADDNVGSGGIIVVGNSNFVVVSPLLNSFDTGAVTWGSGTTGVNGVISASNSLVCSTPTCNAGKQGVTVLTNGNYVVKSTFWNMGAGAATWGSGATGVIGTISSGNSLVGSTINDGVGDSVTALTNGNYVVTSRFWNVSGIADVGAVTWGNGTTGIVGAVSSANSLIGNEANDAIGSSVTALTNGNYVVRSPTWGAVDFGAVTWGNGTSGTIGGVTPANSLVGTTAGDVYNSGVIALTNGNYVVTTPDWDKVAVANVGAVTWGNGSVGKVGVINQTDSLVGSTLNDHIGSSLLLLTNGNYVTASPLWNGVAADVGAATWGNGLGGTVGAVTSDNSLVGSHLNDNVGGGFGGGLIALTNGNYVASSPDWDSGAVPDVGAVTWGNGTGGATGVVSAANSLVGLTVNDKIGTTLLSGNTVVPLSNGNYVVGSSLWDSPLAADAGAATWGNGLGGTIGVISTVNSLVGTALVDAVGYQITPLTNGNYVIASYSWNQAKGAVTLGNGLGGTVGTVSPGNSLVGSITGDAVGVYGVIALTNGNYVVKSPNWNNSIGAATWGDGVSGSVGTVSAANSLIGSTLNDYVGGNITALSNGSYVVQSPNWNGSAIDSGSITLITNSSGPTSAIISTSNSVLGTTASGGISMNSQYDYVNNQLIVGRPADNIVTLLKVGVLTVLSSLCANPNPTSATSVNFTVTFSAPVTGVDISDFSLFTLGGVSGYFISGISGSGSVYTVTVNTGSGNGTIRLDVVDDNSIVDDVSNPLGGAAVGDGNFTTGEVYTITKSAGGDTTGVFRPSNGLLYLKNANTTGFADVAINYGTGGDYPIAGDWDGNGTATIGIYRNGTFYLRNSNTLGFADIAFGFGTPGDQPVAGDWDGDGVDTIGVYSNGQFLLRNSNSAGTADMSFYLGNPGDVGIAGDWNGDGMDTTGVFRPSNGIIFLKNANTTGFADIALNYGLAGDMPVTGDWNNDGIDTIGVYRNAQFMLRNSNTIGFAEIVFALGNPGDMPIAGNWDGIP